MLKFNFLRMLIIMIVIIEIIIIKIKIIIIIIKIKYDDLYGAITQPLAVQGVLTTVRMLYIVTSAYIFKVTKFLEMYKYTNFGKR